MPGQPGQQSSQSGDHMMRAEGLAWYTCRNDAPCLPSQGLQGSNCCAKRLHNCLLCCHAVGEVNAASRTGEDIPGKWLLLLRLPLFLGLNRVREASAFLQWHGNKATFMAVALQCWAGCCVAHTRLHLGRTAAAAAVWVGGPLYREASKVLAVGLTRHMTACSCREVHKWGPCSTSMSPAASTVATGDQACWPDKHHTVP